MDEYGGDGGTMTNRWSDCDNDTLGNMRSLSVSTNIMSCGLGELAKSASFRNSIRRSREPYWIQGVRQQLTDQLKCLDQRLEAHVSLLGEMYDFCRRRAEVEMDYSRAMDKLVRQITARHKTEKQKHESWPNYSTYNVWQAMLGVTRKLGRDHGVLGELFSTCMINQLNDLVDDAQRVHKKCHDMALGGHEELIKVLTELHSSMKTYQQYYNEHLQAENKMRHVESQRVKNEKQPSSGTGAVTAAKTAISRRFKNYEKESEKKHVKYMESGLKAVKARNEYILCIEAANAALQKYFSEDIHELINLMDHGYHSALCRLVLVQTSAETGMMTSHRDCLDLLTQQTRSVDQRADKQAFIDLNRQSFCLPRTFEFQAHRGDDVSELCAQSATQDELYDRLNIINDRLNSLKLDSDELWKTLESTEARIAEMTAALQRDCEVNYMFLEDNQQLKYVSGERDRLRPECVENEGFYLSKYKDYHTVTNLIVRLQSKYNCIEKALTAADCAALQNNSSFYEPLRRPQSVPMKPKRKKAPGKSLPASRPKLFGGTIQEYVAATNEDIPLVIRSCVRVINLYGMHHQGVFRVSGSQHEINEFKNEFERGKDPLPDSFDGKDINSVAGVLKLYFRELREPLFPTYTFDDLISCSTNCSFNSQDSVSASVNQVKALLSTLPKPILIVMRYLFAFLNHLSEFSDENLMDPYNLAVCFGPTLIRVPADRDLVQYNPHATELVRNIIIYHEDIFNNDDLPQEGPSCYEKCLVEDEGRDDSVENLYDDDVEAAGDPSSEEDVKEAIATYDFQARSDKELSFRKGDTLFLHDKVSVDWWQGSTGNNRHGLIPDKYITVRRGREKVDVPSVIRHSDDEKWKSTESLPIVKTFRLSVNPTDDDDLSASHPNVCLAVTRQSSTKSSSPGLQSSESSSRGVFEELERKSIGIVVKVDDAVGEGFRQTLTDEHSAMTLPKRAMSSDRGHTMLERSPVLGRDRRSSSSSSSTERRSLSESADDYPVPRERTSRLSKTNKLFDVGRPLEQENFISQTPSSDDQFKTAEDLALDIDSALAEVMSGIESLGLSHVLSSQQDDAKVVVPEIKKCVHSPQRANSSGTPDLVIGLPVVASMQQHSPKGLNTTEIESSTTSKTSSVPLTNAEVFANVNQSTIKKGTCGSISSTGSSSSDHFVETGSMQTFSRKTVTKTLSVKDASDTADGNSRITEDVGPKSPVACKTVLSVFEPISSSSISGGVPPGKSKPPIRRPEPAPRKDLPKSPEIEFVRSIVPPFDGSGTCVRSLSLARDDCLDKLPSDPDALAALRPSSSVIGGSATLPRSLSNSAPSAEIRIAPRLGTSSADTSLTSATKPPVKVKPPVMKKPARTGDMIKRLQDSLGQQSGGQPIGISVTTSQQ